MDKKKLDVALTELEELEKKMARIRRAIKGDTPKETRKDAIPTKVKVPVERMKGLVPKGEIKKAVIKKSELKRLAKLSEEVVGAKIAVLDHAYGKVLQEYPLKAKNIPLTIKIVRSEKEHVPLYDIYLPDMGDGTKILLDKIREELTSEVGVGAREVLDVKLSEVVEKRYHENAVKKLNQYIPGVKPALVPVLADYLINDMVGLGRIELMLADDNLEEIVINSSQDPIWVYHKMHGWLKTNLRVVNEKQIVDYANSIGRKVERQINTLNPLMDAHLTSGERTNATLFPISSNGNTITIRKFARDPWTVTDFIDNNTLSPEIGAFIWTAMQYEMNMIISGGTASGKTSLLNSVCPFLPPNHRVISIEDTRELRLPEFLHWIPMITRQANPEGKGGVSMLDLMVNSLRMRPDRIIVGEIRRHDEAEVLFEAMHTGHSVYSTLHANTAEEVRRRLITPPLSIPDTLLETLHLIVVQFRHRKLGIRRTLEVAEVVPSGEGGISLRTLYRWRASQDSFSKLKDSVRIVPEIQMFSGLTAVEVEKEFLEKKQILSWLLKHNVRSTNLIGQVISHYYTNADSVTEAVRKNRAPNTLFKG